MNFKIGDRVRIIGFNKMYGTVSNIRSGYYLTIRLDVPIPESLTPNFWIAIPSEIAAI